MLKNDHQYIIQSTQDIQRYPFIEHMVTSIIDIWMIYVTAIKKVLEAQLNTAVSHKVFPPVIWFPRLSVCS